MLASRRGLDDTLKPLVSRLVTLRRGLKSGDDGVMERSELSRGEAWAMKATTTMSAKTHRDSDDTPAASGVLVYELLDEMTS